MVQNNPIGTLVVSGGYVIPYNLREIELDNALSETFLLTDAREVFQHHYPSPSKAYHTKRARTRIADL